MAHHYGMSIRPCRCSALDGNVFTLGTYANRQSSRDVDRSAVPRRWVTASNRPPIRWFVSLAGTIITVLTYPTGKYEPLMYRALQLSRESSRTPEPATRPWER